MLAHLVLNNCLFTVVTVFVVAKHFFVTKAVLLSEPDTCFGSCTWVAWCKHYTTSWQPLSNQINMWLPCWWKRQKWSLATNPGSIIMPSGIQNRWSECMSSVFWQRPNLYRTKKPGVSDFGLSKYFSKTVRRLAMPFCATSSYGLWKGVDVPVCIIS